MVKQDDRNLGTQLRYYIIICSKGMSFLSAEPPWGWKGRYVMGLFAPASISYDPRLAPVTDGERRTKGTGRRWEEGNSSFIQVLYFLPVYIVDSLTVKMASGN